MTGPIVVINPNSTEAVTAGIEHALRPLNFAGGPAIECVTLEQGPPGIESQRDADSVIGPLCDYIGAKSGEAAAFVIACYSDPGLHAARECAARRVYGMAESGIFTALTRAERFGVISILDRSIPRHLRYVRSLGVWSRFAGDRAIGMGIAELQDDARVLNAMIETAKELRDMDNAGVVVMGCAGMARFRRPLEEAVGIPVIEPTLAAVAMALGDMAL